LPVSYQDKRFVLWIDFTEQLSECLRFHVDFQKFPEYVISSADLEGNSCYMSVEVAPPRFNNQFLDMCQIFVSYFYSAK